MFQIYIVFIYIVLYCIVFILQVSLYDLRVDHITCIKSLIKCTEKSRTEVEFHSGFSQEDTDLFIKSVPVKSQRHDPDQPFIHFLKDSYWAKRNYDVTTIYYRFYFYELAEIDVIFYGMSRDNPKKPIELPGGQRTTTTPKRTRRRTTRRPSKYFITLLHYSNIYYNRIQYL